MSNSKMSSPTPSAPAPSPPIVEQMAVGGYSRIMMYQSPNPSTPWPNQYVAIGSYQVVLPREEEIVLSDIILGEIMNASRGYTYEVQNQDGSYSKRTSRRGDLMFQALGSVSAEEADELRSIDPNIVYPQKLTPAAKAALAKHTKSNRRTRI